MTLNQKIRESLKRGDVEKVAKILDDSHQNVSRKLNAKKEIDSVDFINAVACVTGKPFSYFREVTGEYSADAQMDEEVRSYESAMSREQALKKAAQDWKKKHEEAQARIKLLEQIIEAKDDLIEELRKK